MFCFFFFFGLLQLSSLSKALSKDICPPLRNRTVLPLLLSQDHDEHLAKLTEGRLMIFSHDVAPDYLRTKPDLATEQKMIQNEQKASSITAEAAVKQVSQYHKVTTHLWEMVSKAHVEWEMETNSRPGVQQTSSMADTHALVAAVGCGKGIKPVMTGMGGPSTSGSPNMMVPPSIRGVNPNVGGMPKVTPPVLKTNIKSAMSVHGYNR